MPTKIVYFLADNEPNAQELAELDKLNRSSQITVMNGSENVEYGEIDRILPCDYVAGTIPAEYAHIPIYNVDTEHIEITDVVGLQQALDSKVDEPVLIEDVVGLETELDSLHTEIDSKAELPIAISEVSGLQTTLDSKQGKPVAIADVTNLQTSLDSKQGKPVAISDVTGLQAELDAVATLPIQISDVTNLQTSLDSKATTDELQIVIDEVNTKADYPVAIADVAGLQTALDSKATLPIPISGVAGLQAALDASIPISKVTGLQTALDAPIPISKVTGLQAELDSKADLADLDPIISSVLAIKYLGVLSVTATLTPITALHHGYALFADRVTSTEGQDFLLPNDTTLNLPVGFMTTIVLGINNYTAYFNWETGVTVLYDIGFITNCRTKGSPVTAVKRAANSWWVYGDMATDWPV